MKIRLTIAFTLLFLCLGLKGQDGNTTLPSLPKNFIKKIGKKDLTFADSIYLICKNHYNDQYIYPLTLYNIGLECLKRNDIIRLEYYANEMLTADFSKVYNPNGGKWVTKYNIVRYFHGYSMYYKSLVNYSKGNYRLALENLSEICFLRYGAPNEDSFQIHWDMEIAYQKARNHYKLKNYEKAELLIVPYLFLGINEELSYLSSREKVLRFYLTIRHERDNGQGRKRLDLNELKIHCYTKESYYENLNELNIILPNNQYNLVDYQAIYFMVPMLGLPKNIYYIEVNDSQRILFHEPKVVTKKIKKYEKTNMSKFKKKYFERTVFSRMLN